MKSILPTINNIVTIRFIAILAVILGHSIIIYDNSWGLYTTTNSSAIFLCLKKAINVFQMPLFFSLSGFLFFHGLKKEIGIVQFFFKKAWRLLIPYFCICFCWMDPIKISLHVPGYNDIFTLIKQQIFFHNNGHLWYLPTLFFIFIIYKLIYFYINENDNIKSGIIAIVSLILHHYSTTIGAVGGTLFIQILYYQIYFLWGGIIYLITTRNNIKINNTYAIGLIILLILIHLISHHELIRSITTLILVFIFFIIDFRKYHDCKIINAISNNSYGMYLFHSPLIYFTFSKLSNTNPIFILIINFMIFGYLSFILTKSIKYSKFRIIIGEH